MIKKIAIENLIPLIKEATANNQTISFTPSGNSMLPTIDNKKDVVYLGAPNNIKMYDICLFKYQDRYILHRLVKIENEKYFFCGDHNVALEVDVNKEDIIAKVITYTHKKKEKKCDKRFYKKGKRLFITRKIRAKLRRLFHGKNS